MRVHSGSLSPAHGSRRRGRYLGRGRATGHGKTSGRGMKGQFARSGSRRRPGFMGGNLPFILRIPKRGFNQPLGRDYSVVNVSDLDSAYSAGEPVTPKSLVEKGMVGSARAAVKVLGDGGISKPLKVSAHAFSRSAREKIEAAGGECSVIERA